MLASVASGWKMMSVYWAEIPSASVVASARSFCSTVWRRPIDARPQVLADSIPMKIRSSPISRSRASVPGSASRGLHLSTSPASRTLRAFSTASIAPIRARFCSWFGTRKLSSWKTNCRTPRRW